MIFLSIFNFQFSILSAVETIIVGEVVNETTGEAIPNVNIHFRGTKIGTTSDENGNYALRVDMLAKTQLIFSAVGYYTQRFEIEPGQMAGLQVALRERVATITEVIVAPNENPALEILRQIRAHRSENDRTLQPERTTQARREQTLYISQINKKHLRRALWRSLQGGMIQQEDSTFIMPLYRETQSFRLHANEMIPANDQQTQALVLTSTDYSSLIGNEGNLNFYANSVSLMGHAFLSPLASSGNLYYRYYIDEEILPSLEGGDGGRLVWIRFRTRNPFYATFNGVMAIDTSTYALRALQAYVPAEVAVNYLNTLHVSQTLASDNSLAEESISALFDFGVKTEQTATLFPTVLLTTRLQSSAPRDTTRLVAFASDGRANSQGSLNTDTAFQAMDSLPIIRVAKWFATIATTGYIPTGTPVDIGHVEEILQINHHEGVHVGLPFRTNERFSKVVSLEASVGYGFRDRLFKGLGRVSLNLPAINQQETCPWARNILQLEYRDGYVWSEVDDFDRLQRENSMGWGNFDFTSYAFEALHRDSLCVNTAMRQRQLQLYWLADWTQHLETRTYLRAGWQDGYAYQSLSAICRLSWGERKYNGFFMRRYAYSSRYPILYLGLETGHWAFTNNQSHITNHLYAHLRLMLTQHAQLGMGGTLSYVLQTGAIFGTVPNTLLWQANANQGYAYDPYRFTLLHGGELLADKYIALHTEWNGHGILFNLIPGVRYLHLRELVEAKLAYGYRDGHQLYTEVGVGIGNILRVCDLYSVWGFFPKTSSVSSIVHPTFYQWALRFRIHLGL